MNDNVDEDYGIPNFPTPPTIHRYLMDRELGLGAGPASQRLANTCTGNHRGEIDHDQRQLYTRITPRRMAANIDASETIIRRFTPSGEVMSFTI